MEVLLFYLAGVVGIVAWPVLLELLRYARSVEDFWMTALRKAELRPVRRGRSLRPVLEGLVGDVHLRLERFGSRNAPRTRITAWIDAMPGGIELAAETRATRLAKLVEGEDLLTGDEAFDAAVLLHGDPVATLAVLDRTARPVAQNAVQHGIKVRNGCVVSDVPGRLDSSTALFGAVLPIVSLASRLNMPAEPVGKFASGSHRDPIPGFRVRCIELLASSFPDEPRSLAARHSALCDPAPEVRLAAAKGLGQDGEATLVALGTASDVTEPLAVQAIQVLASQDRRGGFGDILDAAVATHRTGVARAVVEHLDAETAHNLTPRLTELLAGDDPELAIPAAGALATAADIGGEDVLLAALARADATARLSIVAALGRIGSAVAVKRLHTVVEAHPLELALRRAATSAIAAIQHRLTDAAPGQVALADGDAGRLAITDITPGLLALAETDAKTLVPTDPTTEPPLAPASRRPRSHEHG